MIKMKQNLLLIKKQLFWRKEMVIEKVRLKISGEQKKNALLLLQ